MVVHKIVAAIVLNPEGKVLIMKRSLKRKTYPGYWALPGGHIGQDESIENVAKREVFEETGLKIKNLEVGPTIKFNKDEKSKFVLTYVKCQVDSSRVKLNKEHTENKWVLAKETLLYKFAIETKQVQKILKNFDLL